MAEDKIIDERDYPLGQVQAAEVELEVLSGSLDVSGGADEFCSARFEYSHTELSPVDDFDQDGDEAKLQISQPSTSGLNNTFNSWDLRFNSGPKMELAIASASGAVRLDLDNVSVSNLEVQSRSGEVELSLGGSYPDLDEVMIDSSSGAVAATLSGNFPSLSEVEIESRSGRTDLVVSGGCPKLNRIAIDSSSGAVSVDMSGRFQRDDLGLRIDSKSGNVRVLLPAGIGASMNAETMSGKIHAQGFSTGPGRKTNAAFGTAPATIWLNIHALSGNIDVVTE